MKIRCPECGIRFEYEDEVVLDNANTLIHTTCYPYALSFIKDAGKSIDIVQKYPFFQQFSPLN